MQSAQRVIHDNSTNLQKNTKTIYSESKLRLKNNGGAKFQVADREAAAIDWISRKQLHANERPKSLAPQPPKISRTTVIRSFFVKNAAKKLHTSAPKNSKSLDFGTLQIVSTFTTK